MATRARVRGVQVERLIVVRLEPNSLAEEAGLVEGDLAVSIDGRITSDRTTFNKAAGKINWNKGVVFDVNRRGRWVYVSFRRD